MGKREAGARVALTGPTDHRVVGAIAGELHVQVHLGGAGGDNLAKIPSAVVPVCAGSGEKVAEVGTGLIPHPHLARGQPVMREVQCREQGWLVAAIQRGHEAVEYSERRAYGSLVGLGLSLVDRGRCFLSPVEIFRGPCWAGERQPAAVRKMRM